MTTSIQGRVVRSVGLDTFADITDVPLVIPAGIDPGGLLFDGDLTAEQVTAIWERMTSRDESDQAARARLRELAAAVNAESSLTNIVALALAQNDYILGVTPSA